MIIHICLFSFKFLVKLVERQFFSRPGFWTCLKIFSFRLSNQTSLNICRSAFTVWAPERCWLECRLTLGPCLTLSTQQPPHHRFTTNSTAHHNRAEQNDKARQKMPYKNLDLRIYLKSLDKTADPVRTKVWFLVWKLFAEAVGVIIAS